MHPYRSFPSPATPSSTSPGKHQHPHHPMYNYGASANLPMDPVRRPSTTHSRAEVEYSDSESTGGEDKTERDKLELRREKNRVKQRNLRQRRANHIADLERSIANLRAEHASMQQTCAVMQQRETHLQGWVHDLESALFRNGHAADVDALRRIWDRDVKRPRVGSMHGGPPPPPPVDPLSTLARAASSIPGPSSNDGRSLHVPSRPSLSRPGSFSTPYDNPYPTPEITWGSQMNEWMHMPDAEKKRKRESIAYDYPPFDSNPGSRPSSRPGPIAGRLSESNIHFLPPIQPVYQPPAIRPLSAPHAQLPNQPLSLTTSSSAMPHSTSPKSIKISDLLSPGLPPTDPGSAMGSVSSGTTGDPKDSWRGEREDISVISSFLASTSGADTPAKVKSELEREPFAPDKNAQNERGLGRSGSGHDNEVGQGVLTSTREQGNTVASADPRQGGSEQHDLIGAAVKGLSRPTLHPSVHTARILLLSLCADHPSTTSTLPRLTAQQQTIILTALSNLSPPYIAEAFRAWQLSSLSATDAKLLLEYQSSFHSDLRLVLFPIAVLRARVISAVQSYPDAFDVTAFISATLAAARIYGDPLDTDAWELPDEYWDEWGQWFPRGRAYCHSLSDWRRRDGHRGSTVLEMICGLESDQGEQEKRRRVDPVGKPPGWTF